MNEADRLARNAHRLTELYPTFARRVQAIITALEAGGLRPRIQEAWRSPQDQLIAYQTRHSKLRFGFHNVTGAGGEKESLAVDLLDDDHPAGEGSGYLLHVAAAAQAQRCITGIRWGLPPRLATAIDAALVQHDWAAAVKVGWDAPSSTADICSADHPYLPHSSAFASMVATQAIRTALRSPSKAWSLGDSERCKIACMKSVAIGGIAGASFQSPRGASTSLTPSCCARKRALSEESILAFCQYRRARRK